MRKIEQTPIAASPQTARASHSSKSSETRVELWELDDGHESEMGYEVRVVHPDVSPATPGAAHGEGPQAPEISRYQSEESARHVYDAYVRALSPPPPKPDAKRPSKSGRVITPPPPEITPEK